MRTAVPRLPQKRLSARAALFGLVLIPPNVVWIVWMERINGGTFSTTLSLFFTAVFSLILLVGLNGLWRRLSPRSAFSQGELLTAYSLLSIGTAMAGVDFGSPLLTLIAHPFRFATPENGWSRFFPYLPTWLTVQDKEVLKGYYEGGATLYTTNALKAWIPPLLCWTGFIALLLGTLACINTLVRAQWMERERLTFPIVQLPVALTAEDGDLWRSRLFWIGAGVVGAIDVLNGLHFLLPSVPNVPFNDLQIGDWFPRPPWRAMTSGGGGWWPVGIFPFVIGLGYLLPVDLLFSCWFFYWFYQFQRVGFLAAGYVNDKARYPYVDEQMFGAFMAVFVSALWSARSHLKEVARQALTDGPEAPNPGEPMAYRTALFGALFGAGALILFSNLAGMPPLLGVLFFAVYFAIAFAVTRMRAELGPPTHDLHFIGPNASLFSILGSANIDRHAMGVFTLYYWFNRAYRCHPSPHEMEGYKMARDAGLSPRGLPALMVLAGVVGIVSTAWTILHTSYQMGAAARIHGWSSLGFGGEAYAKLNNWVTTPTAPDVNAIAGMVGGFLFAGLLAVLRKSVSGFPFHPLGYALSGGWSMMWAWPSLFVAWVIKVAILRYGGLRAYRTALPLFFGAIVGDMVVGALWSLLGLLADAPTYSIWQG